MIIKQKKTHILRHSQQSFSPYKQTQKRIEFPAAETNLLENTKFQIISITEKTRGHECLKPQLHGVKLQERPKQKLVAKLEEQSKKSNVLIRRVHTIKTFLKGQLIVKIICNQMTHENTDNNNNNNTSSECCEKSFEK